MILSKAYYLVQWFRKTAIPSADCPDNYSCPYKNLFPATEWHQQEHLVALLQCQRPKHVLLHVCCWLPAFIPALSLPQELIMGLGSKFDEERRKTFIWGLTLALTCGLGGQRQLLLWQCLMEGVMFCWKSRRMPANWICWWFHEWKRNSAEVKRLAWIILFSLLPACFCPSVGYSHGFIGLKTEGERQRLVYFYSNEISCLPNSVSGAKIKKTPRST